ncbi:hypothetical protein MLD38_029408 [Melastoma candidum]|uniref:Uncharacterized protein n=1 Tax=Melastoma candidum TaxID=119954 RepID=A0ACB9N5T1_9MYRT|nr:hypothetical protein MLD38_029408 [Melastoma candidum]
MKIKLATHMSFLQTEQAGSARLGEGTIPGARRTGSSYPTKIRLWVGGKGIPGKFQMLDSPPREKFESCGAGNRGLWAFESGTEPEALSFLFFSCGAERKGSREREGRRKRKP